MMRMTVILCSVVFLAAMVSGCTTYKLRGKVVDGDVSSILVVDPDDPRLKQPGIAGVGIQLMLDPQKLSRKQAGQTTSFAYGTFSLPVEQTGAGFLEYQAMVTARMARMSPAVRIMPLPPEDKRLLIMLAPGEDRVNRYQYDIIEETRQLGDEFMR